MQVLVVFELFASSILPLELSIDWRIFILDEPETLERLGKNQLLSPELIGIIASRQVAPLVIPVVEVLEAEVVSAVPDYTFRRLPKGDFLLLSRAVRFQISNFVNMSLPVLPFETEQTLGRERDE